MWTRFWARVVESPSGCWVWQGAKTPKGYGVINVGANGTWRNASVHRISYRWFKGPIPSWLQIDHLCRNRACVNPAHLEAVTGQVNVLRGNNAGERAYCKWGHGLDTDNVYIRPDGKRQCRACKRLRDRRYRAATMAA